MLTPAAASGGGGKPGTEIVLFWRTRESSATRENVAARTPGTCSRRSWRRLWSAANCSRA